MVLEHMLFIYSMRPLDISENGLPNHNAPLNVRWCVF